MAETFTQDDPPPLSRERALRIRDVIQRMKASGASDSAIRAYLEQDEGLRPVPKPKPNLRGLVPDPAPMRRDASAVSVERQVERGQQREQAKAIERAAKKGRELEQPLRDAGVSPRSGQIGLSDAIQHALSEGRQTSPNLRAYQLEQMGYTVPRPPESFEEGVFSGVQPVVGINPLVNAAGLSRVGQTMSPNVGGRMAGSALAQGLALGTGALSLDQPLLNALGVGQRLPMAVRNLPRIAAQEAVTGAGVGALTDASSFASGDAGPADVGLNTAAGALGGGVLGTALRATGMGPAAGAALAAMFAAKGAPEGQEWPYAAAGALTGGLAGRALAGGERFEPGNYVPDGPPVTALKLPGVTPGWWNPRVPTQLEAASRRAEGLEPGGEQLPDMRTTAQRRIDAYLQQRLDEARAGSPEGVPMIQSRPEPEPDPLLAAALRGALDRGASESPLITGPFPANRLPDDLRSSVAEQRIDQQLTKPKTPPVAPGAHKWQLNDQGQPIFSPDWLRRPEMLGALGALTAASSEDEDAQMAGAVLAAGTLGKRGPLRPGEAPTHKWHPKSFSYWGRKFNQGDTVLDGFTTNGMARAVADLLEQQTKAKLETFYDAATDTYGVRSSLLMPESGRRAMNPAGNGFKGEPPGRGGATEARMRPVYLERAREFLRNYTPPKSGDGKSSAAPASGDEPFYPSDFIPSERDARATGLEKFGLPGESAPYLVRLDSKTLYSLYGHEAVHAHPRSKELRRAERLMADARRANNNRQRAEGVRSQQFTNTPEVESLMRQVQEIGRAISRDLRGATDSPEGRAVLGLAGAAAAGASDDEDIQHAGLALAAGSLVRYGGEEFRPGQLIRGGFPSGKEAGDLVRQIGEQGGRAEVRRENGVFNVYAKGLAQQQVNVEVGGKTTPLLPTPSGVWPLPGRFFSRLQTALNNLTSEQSSAAPASVWLQRLTEMSRGQGARFAPQELEYVLARTLRADGSLPNPKVLVGTDPVLTLADIQQIATDNAIQLKRQTNALVEGAPSRRDLESAARGRVGEGPSLRDTGRQLAAERGLTDEQIPRMPRIPNLSLEDAQRQYDRPRSTGDYRNERARLRRQVESNDYGGIFRGHRTRRMLNERMLGESYDNLDLDVEQASGLERRRTDGTYRVKVNSGPLYPPEMRDAAEEAHRTAVRLVDGAVQSAVDAIDHATTTWEHAPNTPNYFDTARMAAETFVGGDFFTHARLPFFGSFFDPSVRQSVGRAEYNLMRSWSMRTPTSGTMGALPLTARIEQLDGSRLHVNSWRSVSLAEDGSLTQPISEAVSTLLDDGTVFVEFPLSARANGPATTAAALRLKSITGSVLSLEVRMAPAGDYTSKFVLDGQQVADAANFMLSEGERVIREWRSRGYRPSDPMDEDELERAFRALNSTSVYSDSRVAYDPAANVFRLVSRDGDALPGSGRSLKSVLELRKQRIFGESQLYLDVLPHGRAEFRDALQYELREYALQRHAELFRERQLEALSRATVEQLRARYDIKAPDPALYDAEAINARVEAAREWASEVQRRFDAALQDWETRFAQAKADLQREWAERQPNALPEGHTGHHPEWAYSQVVGGAKEYRETLIGLLTNHWDEKPYRSGHWNNQPNDAGVSNLMHVRGGVYELELADRPGQFERVLSLQENQPDWYQASGKPRNTGQGGLSGIETQRRGFRRREGPFQPYTEEQKAAMLNDFHRVKSNMADIQNGFRGLTVAQQNSVKAVYHDRVNGTNHTTPEERAFAAPWLEKAERYQQLDQELKSLDHLIKESDNAEAGAQALRGIGVDPGDPSVQMGPRYRYQNPLGAADNPFSTPESNYALGWLDWFTSAVREGHTVVSWQKPETVHDVHHLNPRAAQLIYGDTPVSVLRWLHRQFDLPAPTLTTVVQDRGLDSRNAGQVAWRVSPELVERMKQVGGVPMMGVLPMALAQQEVREERASRIDRALLISPLVAAAILRARPNLSGLKGWLNEALASLRARHGAAAPTATGAIAGAGLGAAAGMATGSNTGEKRMGALVGAGLGAMLGGRALNTLAKYAKRGAVQTTPSHPAAQAMYQTVQAPTGPAKALLNTVEREYTALLNRIYPLEKLEKVATGGGSFALRDEANRSAGWRGLMDHYLGLLDENTDPRNIFSVMVGGQHSAHRGVTTLKQVLQLAKGREADVAALLHAERAVAMDFAGFASKGIDPAAARQAAAALGADPQVRAAADAYRQVYRQLLDERLGAGTVSAQSYQSILASPTANPDVYVPFLRDFGAPDDMATGVGVASLMQPNTGLRSMDPNQLAQTMLRDPFELLAEDIAKTARDVARQRVSQTLASLVSTHATALAPYIRELPPLAPGATKQAPFSPQAKALDRDITINVGGVARRYEVLDPDLLAALQPTGPAPLNKAYRLLAGAKTFFTASVTSHPAFVVSNAQRDLTFSAMSYKYPALSAAAGALGGAGVGAAMADDEVRGMFRGAAFGAGAAIMGPHALRTLRALSHALGKTDLWREWAKAGGASEGLYLKDAESLKQVLKQLRGDPHFVVMPVKSVWDALQTVNRAVESAPRLAKYLDERAAGVSEAGAVYAGQDVSVPFHHKGQSRLVQDMAGMSAFWNPNLQSKDKLARMFAPEAGTQGLRRFLRPARTAAVGLTAITAPSIALWEMIHSREDWKQSYEKRPTWEKNLFWMIPTAQTLENGDTQFIRVPKPFEVGFVFASLPERLLDFAAERDPEGTRYALQQMGGSTLEGVVPSFTLAKPLVETMTGEHGYDWFRGREIETADVQRLPERERWNEQTSSLAYGMRGASELPLVPSPQKMDHLLRGFTGSLGGEALNAITGAAQHFGLDPRERDPFVSVSPFRRFTTQPTDWSTDDVGSMLRAAGRAQQEDALMGNSRFEFLPESEQDVVADRANSPAAVLADQYRTLREQYRLIMADRDLTDAERRAELGDLMAEAAALGMEWADVRNEAP